MTPILIEKNSRFTAQRVVMMEQFYKPGVQQRINVTASDDVFLSALGLYNGWGCDVEYTICIYVSYFLAVFKHKAEIIIGSLVC